MGLRQMGKEGGGCLLVQQRGERENVERQIRKSRSIMFRTPRLSRRLHFFFPHNHPKRVVHVWTASGQSQCKSFMRMKTPIFLLFLHNKYSWNSTETDLTSIIVYNTEFRRNKDENLGFSIYYILCISNMFGQDHRERLGALVPTLMRYSATPAVCGYDHPYPFKSSSGKCMCSVWPTIGTVTVSATRSDWL